MFVNVLSLLTAFGLAYLLGAIPAARTLSSGLNSVLPSLDLRLFAFFRVLGDILKGAFAVYLSVYVLGPEVVVIVPFGVLLGHVYPPKNFNGGGNGMGVLLGALAAAHPNLGLVALASWTCAYYVFRHASQAAFVSTLATPAAVAFLSLETHIDFRMLAVLSALIFWKQRDDFVELIRGEQSLTVID